jgi:hypothetical protein
MTAFQVTAVPDPFVGVSVAESRTTSAWFTLAIEAEPTPVRVAPSAATSARRPTAARNRCRLDVT